jgi:hypothetical protein
VKIIEGSVSEGDSILDKDLNIGKILIDKYYPFAIIKFTSDKFNFNSIYKVNNSKIKIIKPEWINKI